MAEPNCCHPSKKQKWFKEPLFLILGVISGLFLVNLVLVSSGNNFLVPVFQKFWDYLSKTWWAILLGLLIGGIVEVFVPSELMTKWLGKSKKSIFLAVALGFLASACSHGILAIAISLYKKGASTAATLAFLLAAPWANFAITLLLFSLLGVRALFIVGGAVLIALIAGFVFRFLEERGIIEGGKSNLEDFKNSPKETKKFITSVWMLGKMTLWWILVGFFLASVLGSFMPDEMFHRFFGPTVWGMIATLTIASIIEICSEGSAPMAFELFEKTRAFGNAFVFLQAGVATDFTEIGIIWTNIGKRAAIALLVVTVPMVLLIGYFLNKLTF
jgi:uncharacterized membrane protein YraQ (UPF0718 family)